MLTPEALAVSAQQHRTQIVLARGVILAGHNLS